MRLKRLELYGYKSFATRSVLEFGAGITAIVGPNGSGKSNIADAVRWVMGEQSLGSLRAKASEDLIFAGTRNRARLGMAEVLITLDNADSWLPLAYTEVTVGRRAFRSGENEYLLNGQHVRYRDVLDLLGGTGLMRSNYTVIGQGVVDAALTLRPEARRALFEEAAGIVPHLRKRAEALKRIEEAEHNLERVNDLLNELRPTAAALRRQAERAEESQLLTQDLRELQRIWYGYHWQRRGRQLARAQERVKEQEALLQSQRAYLRTAQEQVQALAARQADQRQRSETLQAQHAALRDQSELARRELAVATERIRLSQKQQTFLHNELQVLLAQQAIVQQELARAEAELREQQSVQEAGQTELLAARQQLAADQERRQAVEQQTVALRARLAQLAASLSDLRARLEQGLERRLRLVAQQAELTEALTASVERERGLRSQRQNLEAQERQVAERWAALQKAQVSREAALAEARQQLAAGEGTLAQLRAGHERLVARRDLLTRLHHELTGYYPGVREVLNPQSQLKGLLGTVANLMVVPDHLEQALEAALGPRLQHIIAEHWEDAEQAIAHLKRTRAGWATFLPLDTLRTRPALTLRAEKGVVGVASALVQYEERLRAVFELLLGTTVIVQELPAARRLLDQRTGASLFVTLAGETVQPSGILSGGARRDAALLLAQEREWRDLPPQVQSAEAALAEALQQRATLQGHLADLERQARDEGRQAQSLRVEREAAQKALAHHTQEERDLQRESQWREARIAQVQQELHELEQREQTWRAQLAEAQAAASAATDELAQHQARLADGPQAALRQRAAELETHLAVAQRAVHSQHTLLDSHRANARQLGQQVGDKQTQLAALEQDLQRMAAASTRATDQLAAVEDQTTRLRQQVQPLLQDLARLEKERREAEYRHLDGQKRLNEAELDFNRATLELERIRDEQTALAREVEAELGPIDLPGPASQQLRLELGDDVVELPAVDGLPPGLSEEIRELKARLRRLGVINPNAPQEYEQLLERQTFLQGQVADLRGAIAALHEVMHELDAVIERDFAAAIAKTDAAFRDCFSSLFNGGSAQLVLTDPEHIHTTGVDIIAQPPGKRPQNLALLSGGERALTAAALLFALLQANPVPFCILDEVDAALDEANVARFLALLCEQATNALPRPAIQFVVITHNRRTIEVASTIYGISMGEQGVSQCISLRLGEALAAAET